MFIIYDDFKNIVPKETLEFVKRVLPLIDDYKKTYDKRTNKTIKIKNNDRGYDDTLRRDKDIILAILLHTYYKNNQTHATLLTKYGYDDTKLLLRDSKKNSK